MGEPRLSEIVGRLAPGHWLVAVEPAPEARPGRPRSLLFHSLPTWDSQAPWRDKEGRAAGTFTVTMRGLGGLYLPHSPRQRKEGRILCAESGWGRWEWGRPDCRHFVNLGPGDEECLQAGEEHAQQRDQPVKKTDR